MAKLGDLADKSTLKRALNKLRLIQLADTHHEGGRQHAQEMLDVLALLAGLKPVYLLGRGFEDQGWAAGVAAFAEAEGLIVVDGPYWRGASDLEGFPSWYIAASEREFAGFRARYICRTRAFADEVRAVNAAGRPSTATEAQLLGFPECCVRAHRGRERAYHEYWYSTARRRTSDDEAAILALLAADEALEPATAEDAAKFRIATDFVSAPFTSVNTCDSCAGSAPSPAMRLSARYAELARVIGATFFSILEPRPNRSR